MRRKLIMGNNINWSLVILGAILTLVGIYLGFVGAEILNIPFVRMDLVPIAIGFCGVLLVVSCGSAILYEKGKTREQLIMENDERNITINQHAKSKAFDLMTVLFSFAILALALFGYMNKVSFFTLTGIFLLSQVYFGYQFLVGNKTM